MSPYMKTIREHLCWRKFCLHSSHPEANITQSRQFGFVKKSSREMCNYLKLTQPNNWVIFLRKVSHVLFLNISERRLWDGNSLDPSLFECTSSSLERECRTRSWGPGYILLVILYRRVKVPSVRSILYSTT